MVIVLGAIGLVGGLAALYYVKVIKKRSDPREFVDVDSGTGKDSYVPPAEGGV